MRRRVTRPPRLPDACGSALHESARRRDQRHGRSSGQVARARGMPVQVYFSKRRTVWAAYHWETSRYASTTRLYPQTRVAISPNWVMQQVEHGPGERRRQHAHTAARSGITSAAAMLDAQVQTPARSQHAQNQRCCQAQHGRPRCLIRTNHSMSWVGCGTARMRPASNEVATMTADSPSAPTSMPHTKMLTSAAITPVGPSATYGKGPPISAPPRAPDNIVVPSTR